MNFLYEEWAKNQPPVLRVSHLWETDHAEGLPVEVSDMRRQTAEYRGSQGVRPLERPSIAGDTPVWNGQTAARSAERRFPMAGRRSSITSMTRVNAGRASSNGVAGWPTTSVGSGPGNGPNTLLGTSSGSRLSIPEPRMDAGPEPHSRGRKRSRRREC